MKRITLAILVFIFLSQEAIADGILMAWGMNDLPGMTKEKFDNAKTWSAEDVIQKNLEAKTWPEAYLIAVGANKNKDAIIEKLIEQLDDSVITKLTSTSRLIIWERILSDDILFEGKGYQVDDDLFALAGRANWVLRNITGKSFGHVKPNTTIQELKELQSKWQQWHKGKNVQEYINPFDSKEKALDETHSLIAFEALIYSLRPSIEKELLTKDCLKRIYQLDELPADKGSPASYCSPDTYSFFYLDALIGEKESTGKKTYDWWLKWWNEHKTKLIWDAEKGIFKVSK